MGRSAGRVLIGRTARLLMVCFRTSHDLDLHISRSGPLDNVGRAGNQRTCHGVLVDVTTTSEPSLKRRAFLGVAAGGVAAITTPAVVAIAAPAVARAASTQPTQPTHPTQPT